jgi:hypothetical protein
MAGKVKVKVAENVTVTASDGTVHRAGDVFEVPDDDTLAQWLAAGTVTKAAPKARKKK